MFTCSIAPIVNWLNVKELSVVVRRTQWIKRDSLITSAEQPKRRLVNSNKQEEILNAIFIFDPLLMTTVCVQADDLLDSALAQQGTIGPNWNEH